MSAVSQPTDLEAEDGAEPATALEVPFWEKYNAHYEFPSSVVLSVLAFVTFFAVVIGVLLVALAGGPDRTPVPIRMVDGTDDTGDGSMGSGGTDQPIALGNRQPEAATTEQLPNRQDLPEVKKDNPTRVEDPTAPGQLDDSSKSALQKLEEALKNGAVGGRRGNAGGEGSGTSGQPGAGVGGDGTDNTRKRSLRWSLRFTSASGRDYVDQLAAMKAVLVIPQPPDEKDALVYRDLAGARQGVRLGEAEWTQLAGQIQFMDTKADSVRGLAEALGIGFVPRRFFAFFPSDLEKDLARMELAYRNRRAEDIEETVFRVTVRGGQYDIVVEEQRPKR